jgi:hypothetical protein
MSVECKRCGIPVADEKKECQACGEDNGYPNVRLAQRPDEVQALVRRLHDAEVSSTARNCKEILEKFGLAVLGSKAVISRSLSVVQDLIESDRRTYTKFQRQLAYGARVAEDNEADRVRTQFEAALFPNFHQDVLFALLSMNNRGLTGYGAYAMILKEDMIAHRASVFEENLLMLSAKRAFLLHEPIPPGFRAEWGERNTLAKAKLHSEIGPGTCEADFPAILVRDGGGPGNSDFIEVHIYGPLNRYTIERVVGPTPRTREDRAIWKRLERLLSDIGAYLEAA